MHSPSPTRRPTWRNARRATAGAAALLLLAGCAGTTSEGARPAAAAAAAWHGVEPTEDVKRPSFTLRDLAGNRYDFAAETRGRPTLMYFGYTNCPDECPTALADIATALRQAPSEIKEDVKVVMVTTDPKRDTPPVLREWLAKFRSDFIALTGTPAEVDAAQRAAGIQVAKAAGPIPTLPGKPNEHPHKEGTAPHTHTGPLGYGVEHANVIFAYSADDTLPVVYPGGVTPADIAADLPRLATKGASL